MPPRRFEIEIERPIAEVFDYFVAGTRGLAVREKDQLDWERWEAEVSRHALERWQEIRFVADDVVATYRLDRSIQIDLRAKKRLLSVSHRLTATDGGTSVVVEAEMDYGGIWGVQPLRALSRWAMFAQLRHGLEDAKSALESDDEANLQEAPP